MEERTYWSTKSACLGGPDRLAELEAENASLRAENASLRAELTELKALSTAPKRTAVAQPAPEQLRAEQSPKASNSDSPLDSKKRRLNEQHADMEHDGMGADSDQLQEEMNKGGGTRAEAQELADDTSFLDVLLPEDASFLDDNVHLECTQWLRRPWFVTDGVHKLDIALLAGSSGGRV